MNEYRIMKILRESKNYSQEYVAGKLGINQNAYSKMENGKVKLTLDRIRQLAEIYDIKPEYFLSLDLPVINFNIGPNSHGGFIDKYVNNSNYFDPELIQKLLFERDKIIDDKNTIIEYLKKEITNLRNENEELLSAFKKKLDSSLY